MRAIRFCCFVALLMVSQLWAGTPSHVRLRLSGNTTVHVGQITVLQMPSAHKYIVTLEGSDALVPLKRAQDDGGTPYVYRATRPGRATLLIVPAGLKQGDCIDCVTRHCFVTVVP
jgi:hypothetical protein